MRTILAILCGLTVSGAAVAADLPVAPPSPMIRAETAGKGGTAFAQTFTLGGLNLKFQQVGLNDIRARLGGGVVDTLGSGTDRMNWLCYDLPEARLWMSDNELGVSEIVVAKRSRTAPVSSHCPALSAQFQSVEVDGFLTLGTSRTDLISRLGSPTKDAGDWIAFARRTADRGGENNQVVVRLENGKVAALWATRTLSK